MNEIEKKALALVNEIRNERGAVIPYVTVDRGLFTSEALCRAIERHEAYKQEVSNALKKYFSMDWNTHKMAGDLRRFIIPKPTVDPLAAALAECEGVTKPGPGYDHDAKVLREALAKRGLKIVEDV